RRKKPSRTPWIAVQKIKIHPGWQITDLLSSEQSTSPSLSTSPRPLFRNSISHPPPTRRRLGPFLHGHHRLLLLPSPPPRLKTLGEAAGHPRLSSGRDLRTAAMATAPASPLLHVRAQIPSANPLLFARRGCGRSSPRTRGWRTRR
uniref:Uncharacterized protein n=1 Tax=Aegilops tauschii subsp. strangulata TaxID=200361 RepID=A0A453IX29_AEGTS